LTNTQKILDHVVVTLELQPTPALTSRFLRTTTTTTPEPEDSIRAVDQSNTRIGGELGSFLSQL
jgi:hypothetical protein